MKCPSCNTSLHMTERKGIEIDYCPKCRGVWLDRGELDKILEKTLAEEEARHLSKTPPSVQPQQVYAPQSSNDAHGTYNQPSGHHGFGHGHGKSHGHGYQKRRKSWLMDLFD